MKGMVATISLPLNVCAGLAALKYGRAMDLVTENGGQFNVQETDCGKSNRTLRNGKPSPGYYEWNSGRLTAPLRGLGQILQRHRRLSVAVQRDADLENRVLDRWTLHST